MNEDESAQMLRFPKLEVDLAAASSLALGSATSSSATTNSSRLFDSSGQHHSVRAPRPAFLPDKDGMDVPIPQFSNPFLLPGATSGPGDSCPMIAAPVLIRIDGGDPDSSLSDGLDEIGRLRPLDTTKFALFHIPSAVYPSSSNCGPPNRAPGSSYEATSAVVCDESSQQPFVPLSMPAAFQHFSDVDDDGEI